MPAKIVKTQREFDNAIPNQSVYSREFEDGHFAGWSVKRLWELSKDLPSKKISIEPYLPTLEQVISSWAGLNDHVLYKENITAQTLMADMTRVRNANLKYPILLEDDPYYIMDGMHRLCKQFLMGYEQITVVQFVIVPDPDVVWYPKNKVQHW